MSYFASVHDSICIQFDRLQIVEIPSIIYEPSFQFNCYKRHSHPSGINSLENVFNEDGRLVEGEGFHPYRWPPKNP